MVFLSKITKTALLLLVLLLLNGCTQSNMDQEKNNGIPDKITIAFQYGLGYAPVQIVKEKRLIEQHLPNVRIEWKNIGSGGVIRESMITGDLDIGFMGIPPFLIGWDKGIDWKIATALVSSPMGLQSNRKDITSLKDFKEGDKIALPSPGSVQHILLSMAAKKYLGNPNALDSYIVAMDHPDGANALISDREITAHFTSPPYLYKELESDNIKQILDANDAFGGENTFLVGVATKEFHDSYPEAYEAFVLAISEAISMINTQPKDVAELLADEYRMTIEEVEKYLTWPGTNYTTKIYGLVEYADFMKEAGYITKVPEDINEVIWKDNIGTQEKNQEK